MLKTQVKNCTMTPQAVSLQSVSAQIVHCYCFVVTTRDNTNVQPSSQ